MKVVLHGVRGSSPASGRDFVAVGGRTSCVAVTPPGVDLPTLLLDGGTGLSSVTESLAGNPYRGDLLLTHLHWDHVQGIPFFAAADREDAETRLMLPAQLGAAPDRPGSAAALLARSMSPPHFPISPEGLLGSWTFEAIEPGWITAGGFAVMVLEIPHKGGRTFGYRVQADDASFAYLPDHNPAADPRPGLDLASGVDVLIHGGMFDESELDVAQLYGHATIGEACQLAREAEVGTLVLTHHAPTRTDEQVAALVDQLGNPQITLGREGDAVLDG